MSAVVSLRFVNALNMRATKCATCLDTLHFVRPSSRCAGKLIFFILTVEKYFKLQLRGRVRGVEKREEKEKSCLSTYVP